MPSDDEIRRVAEDLRALARSLGQDARQAVRDAYREGGPGALRDAANQARATLRSGWSAASRPAWGPPKPEDGVAGDAPPDPAPRGPSAERVRRGAGWERRTGGGPPWAHRCTPPPWHRDRPVAGGPRRATGPVLDRRAARDRRGLRPRRAPLPPVRHRRDSGLLLAALALATAVLSLLVITGTLHAAAETSLATCLVILGAAMVVTARTDWSLSRHVWPLLLGLALVGLVVSVSAVPGARRSVGDVRFVASPDQPVPAVISTGVGDLNVDLRALPAGVHDVTIEGLAGASRVALPAGRPVDLDAHLDGGQISVNGVAVRSGPFVREHQHFGPPGHDVVIDVSENFGTIEVAAP